MKIQSPQAHLQGELTHLQTTKMHLLRQIELLQSRNIEFQKLLKFQNSQIEGNNRTFRTFLDKKIEESGHKQSEIKTLTKEQYMSLLNEGDLESQQFDVLNSILKFQEDRIALLDDKVNHSKEKKMSESKNYLGLTSAEAEVLKQIEALDKLQTKFEEKQKIGQSKLLKAHERFNKSKQKQGNISMELELSGRQSFTDHSFSSAGLSKSSKMRRSTSKLEPVLNGLDD